MKRDQFIRLAVLFLSGLLFISCSKQTVIIPESGYDWPRQERSYWPTDGWRTSPLDAQGMDPAKMEGAHQFARNDELSRALLVIKNGYLVFEEYYGDGGVNQSTNLWSVTKSITSILVGKVMDDKFILSTDQLMKELMPEYPEFNDITLHHVLTQTTGLAWAEEGPLWVKWIFSDDWVAEALARGQVDDAGKQFKYSSGNSHFLSALIYHRTGITPGMFAKQHFFDPMGISFEPLSEPITYSRWEEYTMPLSQTWRQDPQGIECASFALYLTARDMAKFGFLYLNRGKWADQTLVSEQWVEASTKDQETDIYGRYSYGYQWWITKVGGYPAFLASGFGGQIIGLVPALDLVVVIKYEAENPVHPKPGTDHDDMRLFELVVESIT